MEARILVATVIGGMACACNEVIDFPDKLAKQAEKEGLIDATPEAVAYCTGELNAKVRVYVPPSTGTESAPEGNGNSNPA